MPKETKDNNDYTSELLERIIVYFNKDEKQEAFIPVNKEEILPIIVEDYAQRYYPEAIADVRAAHYNDPEEIAYRRRMYEFYKKKVIKDGDESTIPEDMKEQYYKLKEEFEKE